MLKEKYPVNLFHFLKQTKWFFNGNFSLMPKSEIYQYYSLWDFQNFQYRNSSF